MGGAVAQAVVAQHLEQAKQGIVRISRQQFEHAAGNAVEAG